MAGKIFLSCLFVLSALYVYALNDAPVWLDMDVRNIQYPQHSYYTGYSEVFVGNNETREQAVDRAKQKAVGELSGKIRVFVDTENKSLDISTSGTEFEEKINSVFVSSVKTASQASVVDYKIDTYYDARTNLIYAFAYVGKSELRNYFRSQISLYLDKVAASLATATELLGKGYKMKARNECIAVAENFAIVEYSQDLLTAIDEDADEPVLQKQRSEYLRNELIQTIADLENSIYLYLDCKELVNGQSVVHIADRLPGIIMQNGCGCSFTDSQDNADYIIRIEAKLSRCQDAPDNIVFCYAFATVSVVNTVNKKTVIPKIPECKGGWTQRNRANATEEAFNELAEKIAEKVVPIIKN